MSESTPEMRYDRLWKAIDRGLERNRTTINVREAVKVAYGKDISIFAAGGESTTTTTTTADATTTDVKSSQQDAAINLLASLLEGVLDGANDAIREEIQSLFKTNKVEEQLTLLDEIIHEFDLELKATRDAELLDKVSAQEEVKRAKIPDGISVSDLLTVHAYKCRSRIHQDLVQELNTLEEENEVLVKELEQMKDDIRMRIQKLEDQAKSLETLADQCSLHGAL